MATKYFQPTSLTWWSGVAMIAEGLILLAAQIVPSLAPLAAMIRPATGGMGPMILINGGLAAIGIKGAIISASK